jgi:hypothetical protein
MRARGIKPSFFTDEALVELPFEARLLFMGLWCVADREGRLQDRPKQLRIQLFPCDSVDVDGLLDRLQGENLILRYQVAGARYIQVINFKKHQRPHQNEVESVIPGPEDGAPEGRESTTKVAPEYDQGCADSDLGDTDFALTPDSCLLTADSTKTILSEETSDPADKKATHTALVKARFEHWKAIFPEETARLSLTEDRKRAISGRLREGIAPETIDEAVTNARGDPWWNGAQDGAWKADIKTICGKGSTVENLAARSRHPASGLARLRAQYGGEP